jgi:hypothetical protein
MATALDIPTDQIESWIQRWSEVVFEPRSAFQSTDKSNTSTSVQFFVINQLLAYALLIAGSAAFFLFYYRSNIIAHVKDELGEAMTATAALSLAYCVLIFLSILASSVISWFISRPLGSIAKFPRHFRAALDLTALDPLSIPFIGLLLLGWSELSWSLIAVSTLGIILSKGSAAISGYWAFSSIHQLQGWRMWILFIFGHFLQQTIFSTLCAGILWLLIAGAIIPKWD